MRVFHLISSGGFYGAERVVLTLSKTLNDMGHPATIGVFHNAHVPNIEVATHAQSLNLPVQLIACGRRFDWGTVRTLRDVFESAAPEVLHTHGYKADTYGYLAARGSKIALVSTCHNWLDENLAVYLYGVLDRFVLRKFDMTVAVSEAVANQLRAGGVAEDKVRIISNGIDVEAFSNAQPTIGRDASKCTVGLVGRLAPEKGIQFFLEAAARVLRSNPRVEFIVVGDGPERENLQQTAERLGVQSSVRFTGKLEDMPGVYASLDMLVSSSLKEGLPMTILEAMAAGRPVVATAVGAVPRLVLHEQTGLLVPPADAEALARAILRLLGGGELREKLACQGRQLIQDQFSAKAMAAQYVKVYEEGMEMWSMRKRRGYTYS
jgi:glycosyltransferase involved in cell wall biosynthesis